MNDDPVLRGVFDAARRDGERRAPRTDFDRLTAAGARRTEARRALRRSLGWVALVVVALAVLAVWLLLRGAEAAEIAVVAPFLVLTFALAGWWFFQVSDKRRYGRWFPPLTVTDAAQETARRSADLAARGREFGVVGRTLAVTATVLEGRIREPGDPGDVDRLRSGSRALHRASKTADDLGRRVTRQCEGVTHFVEGCEGDPAGAANEYGRTIVLLDRPVLRLLLDQLLAEIDQAHADVLAVAFALDDAEWTGDVTHGLQAVDARLRGVVDEVRGESYRLSRAVDRLHLLATRSALDGVAAGTVRRYTTHTAAGTVVRGRPVEHRPASRTVFAEVVTDQLDSAWRSIGRGGMAAIACVDRVGDP